MKEHFSLKLALTLFLIIALIMSLFAVVRHQQSNELFESQVTNNSKVISERIASQVSPSIWEIYLSSVNRRFSEEAASAVLSSEMKNLYIDAIVVYGRFGHVYMGKVSHAGEGVEPYLASLHEEHLGNHPNRVDHPIKNGSMTIGKVTVYFNDEPLREQVAKAFKLDLIQIFFISLFIILVLFFAIKRVLIQPLESLKIAKNTFNSLDEGILYVDNEHRVFNANPAFSRMTGFGLDHFVDKDCDLFSFDESDVGFWELIDREIDDHNTWSGEAYCSGNAGNVFPVQLTVSQVKNDENQDICRVLVFQDISKQKEAERKLKDLAFYDALTGLANRRHFEELMMQEIAASERSREKMGLLFIDLDDFKFINDSLGHNEGDELLVEMARRFNERVRNSDHIARFGGDEFTVIATRIESEEVLTSLAEDLIQLAAAPIVLQGKSYKVSATIGISIYPKDGAQIDELVKHADSAMYQAKESGKGKYSFYSSALDLKIQHRQRIKSLLRNCLDNNELYLQYQPKVGLNDRHPMTGAEALLRWNSEEFGLIPPDEFIPLAEESGAIIRIGEWVIQQSFKKVAEWNYKYSNKVVKLAINLSSHQLHNTNLVPFIRREMQTYDVDPKWVEFEITESAIITDFDASVVVLQGLKEMGFSLSLDDFGTGYSSLSYLTKLPIDILKIDKSFVFEVGESRRAESVVETIVALSKSLGLETIAEGIETKVQLAFLKELGCELGQGYYFSRPLSENDFENYMNTQFGASDNVVFLPGE